MIDAGTWPERKPGRRATFWYFWTIVSVSRATSAAGISTEISRFTPSFFASFLRSTVSVGLTLPFRLARTPGHSHAVHLSVKTEGEQRQTSKRHTATQRETHSS